MHIWTRSQIARPVARDWWLAAGLLALIIGLGLCAAALPSCSAGQCTYDARFDGRDPDPDNNVYPYYLVAQCPGQATATIIESATRLHIPR